MGAGGGAQTVHREYSWGAGPGVGARPGGGAPEGPAQSSPSEGCRLGLGGRWAQVESLVDTWGPE